MKEVPIYRVCLLVLGIVATGAACSSTGTVAPAEEVPPDLAPEVQRAAQLDSLAHVFYRDTPSPPPPSEAELTQLDRTFGSAPAEEWGYLEEYYGGDRDLLVFATRDSDGDGVRDYRVSDYYGKFMEGDVDVDGDGVRNVLDSSPYDASSGGRDRDGDGLPDEGFTDANRNGLPDHVDWRLLGKGEDAAARQEALYRDHGIILVDRSAAFTDELSRSVYDALTRIFRGPLERSRGLPALRTIATEETCLLTPEVDDATNAMAVAQTQSLLIYRIGIDYEPFVQLGLIAHELGHNYQFSLDFDEADLRSENLRVYFPAPRFHAEVEPFGWAAEEIAFDPEVDGYQVFTPQYYEVTPYYTWYEETLEEWAAWLEDKYRRHGADYLEDAEVVEWGVVGDYSLTNPWEWYSDSLIAYTFLEIDRKLREVLDERQLESVLGAMAETVAEAWPGFRYQNIDQETVEPHLREAFPLTDDDLRHFGLEYVKPLVGTQ